MRRNHSPIPTEPLHTNRRPHRRPEPFHLVIQDLFLRWIVTTLFVISATECVYGIAARPPFMDGLRRKFIAHSDGHCDGRDGLAARRRPPANGPLVVLPASDRLVHRRHTGPARAPSGQCLSRGDDAGDGLDVCGDERRTTTGFERCRQCRCRWHGSSSMPGMNMPAMDAAPDATGAPPFITGLNWLFTIGFAVAGAWWLSWFSCAGGPSRFLRAVCRSVSRRR